MLEFSDLTKFDFKILEYVKDNGPISEEKIISHFDSDPDVTSLRIQELSKVSIDHNYPNLKGYPVQIVESSYLYNESGELSISRRGKKAIQDWKQNHSYKAWNNIVRSDLALAVAVLSLILSFYSAFSKTC